MAFLKEEKPARVRAEQISNVCPGGDDKKGSNAGIGGATAGVADSERWGMGDGGRARRDRGQIDTVAQIAVRT